MSTLGERIKIIRQRASMTQADFGKEIGVSGAAVSTSESGKTNPENRTILLICEKFGVNREWLETGNGEMLNVHESASLIPRLQRILQDYPLVAKTLEAAMEVMRPEDFDRMTEIIQQTVETLKNARG